ncbi:MULTISPECIES: asparagine synthase-related protein [Microbacterium]|uniref:asparagine synthase-related protein n=1 Tax=Microbacterium TaxID=33882 RepID=UPI0012ECCBE9|nr:MULTISPECIES: asparagine synthase-related protein [Microbacterium]MDR7191205.1 asparagine synthase (glutamine-hydrolyzing) [Microbacterium sp. BE35]
MLSRTARRADGRVAHADIVALLRHRPDALTRLLPPFGALGASPEGAEAVADSMGFQHIFHSDPGEGTVPLVSTSALLAARALDAQLDPMAVGIQSLLGWQLGGNSLFAGVKKLEAGAVVTLDERGVTLTKTSARRHEPISPAEAVQEAADLLRTSLNAVLDDYPDAVLQLTGGMDSRLLLSAIPPARRRGLRAMTLDVPGKGDTAIASMIAQQYGIRHDVRGLTDVAGVSAVEAWELCRIEATRLDAMADPVALAAQRIAERAFDQGVRISGLGGEIARGFYYVGRVRDRTYDRQDAARLAAWRMFVNEAVEPGLLVGEFAAWAESVATAQVHDALVDGGEEWFRATDELYLRHRMQRWAGATDLAVSVERIVINPMLDEGFLDLAYRLRPQDKVNSRFLGALQMELDPELGKLPLDGRPAPATYAAPSRWEPVTQLASTGKRFARKAIQRVQRGNRPPAGGTILAAKVVEHWRAESQVLRPLEELDFVDPSWVSRVLDGSVDPRPSSVAFLTNLIVATSDAG